MPKNTRTTNALNECHRHINVKFVLNHDSSMPMTISLFNAFTYIQYDNNLTLKVQQTKW